MGDAGCGLPSAAFCETFDQPSPVTRSGELDPTKWVVARYGHPAAVGFFQIGPMSTPTDGKLFPATLCGAPFANILPPYDVKICSGTGIDGKPSNQLQEVMNDQGDFSYTSMRILQPFDFTNRTGRLVMDVDAKVNPLNLGHGWWVEVWITEDPAPMPYHGAPTVAAYPRAGVGMAFQFGGDCPEPGGPKSGNYTGSDWQNSLGGITVTKDFEILHSIPFWEFNEAPSGRCFNVADTKMNHLEFLINKDKLEFWASDYEKPGSFRLLATVNNLDLPFSKGYVHLQHAAYNAPKDGNVTDAQTFRWDNIGFDGPTYPTPRTYVAPDNNQLVAYNKTRTGYMLGGGETQTLVIPNVNLTKAVAATLNFNTFGHHGQRVEYSINGTWHTYTIVSAGGAQGGTGLRTHSTPVALTELANGDNTVAIRINSADLANQNQEMVGNVDITLEIAK